MRYVAVVIVAAVLASCSTAPPSKPVSSDRVLSPDLQFLLTVAATDFHTHRPPDPVRFRDVRLGHLTTASGETRYMLCDQFLPAEGGDNARWVPFATIKTSDYEQWIGDTAAGFCQGSSIKWDDAGDLSLLLQTRVDSLR